MEEKKYYSRNRRMRASRQVRELTAGFHLSHKDFIQPLFVDENISEATAISSLNGVFSDTIETVVKRIDNDVKNGVSKFLLFPVPATKRENDFNYEFVLDVLNKIRSTFGDSVWIATDVCLCSYTLHGHCGILNSEGNKVLNHETVKMLADYSLQLAQAGANCIAPSDMMDGRIGAIRTVLDTNNFDDVTIMSYSAKFSSQFYGPFRNACKSAPGSGSLIKDRKTYQLSPLNTLDALLSAGRDVAEGTDIIMIKPALPYLDIIYRLKQEVRKPLAAYHVSGEYQGIELLAQHKLVDRVQAHGEVWTALKRAGAEIIISYASRYAKEWIDKIEN